MRLLSSSLYFVSLSGSFNFLFTLWQIFPICSSNFSLLSITISKIFCDIELSIVILVIWMFASSCVLNNKWHLPGFAFIWLLGNQVNNVWVILVRFSTFSMPGGNYMFKVNNINNRTRCEVCAKLTMKIPERRQWYLYC